MPTGKRVLVVLSSAVLALAAWFTLLSEGAARKATERRDDKDGTALVPARDLGEVLPPVFQGSDDISGILERRWSPRGRSIAKTLWVEGHVVIPPDTPADEALSVRARRRDVDQGSAYEMGVSHTGTFRLGFADGTTKGSIVLRGRYVYSDEDLVLDPRTEKGPLTVEARLGGRILGSLRIPADSEATPASLSGARLQLFEAETEGASRRARRSVEPDGLGFALDALPPGEYVVGLAGNAAYARESEPVVIEAGKAVGVALDVYAGATLAGRVVDEDEKPLVGLEVRASTGLRGKGVDDLWRKEITDLHGVFRLRGLPPGERSVRVAAPGFRPYAETFVLPGEGETLADVVLLLQRGESVSGSVTWPDGSPAEATIAIAGTAEAELDRALASSGPDGTFRVTGLAPGPHRVEARAVLTEDVRAVSPVTGKERPRKRRTSLRAVVEGVEAGTEGLRLVLDRGLALAGTVCDDAGRPLETFSVEATREQALAPSDEPTESIRETFEAASGAFELVGLYDGTWTIRVSAPGHAQGAPFRVELPREPEPIELALDRCARIEGVVFAPGSPARPSAVVLLAAAGLTDGPRECRIRPGDGGFVFENVPPGDVRLEAKAGPAGRSAALALELAPGEVRNGIVLELLPCGAIEVDVVDAAGRPEAGREVRVRDERLGILESARTNTEGRAVLLPLPTGTYEVEVIDERAPADVGTGGPASFLPRRMRVVLDAGETERVLLPPGELGADGIHGRMLAPGTRLAAARSAGGRRNALAARSD
jgi:hypothetical protein